MKDDGLRLIGDDATIEAVTFGTEEVGDDESTLDELAGGDGLGAGFWLITAKAVAASIWGALKVGDLFPALGTEVPKTGDKGKLVTTEPFLDSSGWSLTFSSTEVETTVIRDQVKKYRKGKADADGSLKGVMILGETTKPDGILNQFVKIIRRTIARPSLSPTIEISEVNSHPLFIRGLVRDSSLSEETSAFLFAQIELFGTKLGADMGSKQEYESKFRLTGADPVYYEIENV